ncbi:uncharacterized protein KY384_005342 [Bacidia gigantensis]|uniref:uncharacterized protein n=1 Tax=Bacidia gigantensis TaxID=2732470 RepID=UPI001D054B75|nr:uncharacterized protein KY384_005342 [Bacidia gigantensis]KAG8529861.1 hypothetical protein KY384_005342 [Bacidia gigantensis]
MAQDLASDYLDDHGFDLLLAAQDDKAGLLSASTTKVSVDGEHGDIVTRNAGMNRDDNLALVRLHGANRDGQHGIHAPAATPGEPGGFIAVELFESTQIEEGVHVEVSGFASRVEPPESIEVPARRDLILSAVGGNGQEGQVGSNGQAGMNGIDGTNATREVDATPGTNGGNGGNAGLGTNGADGGRGGTVEISIDEDNTHLLFAVQWDTRGGKGGKPGRHGNPGSEGTGGNGGVGHQWSELVGYRYRCSVMGSANSSIVAAIRAQAVEGNNLQAMIAAAATRYGARRHQATDTGSCRCKGGNGNCAGCVPIPIHSQFHRQAGWNGRDGRPGATQTKPLFPGLEGDIGGASIFVKYHNGRTERYSSQYLLELVDFDVEDENGDGIFEPGERVSICRIRIRNRGGMPSPKCRIPISAVASDWFLPVDGEDGVAYMQSSITPGTIVTLNSSLMVLIHQPADLQVFNKSAVAIGASSSNRRRVELQASFPADRGSLQSPEGVWQNNVERQIHHIPATDLFVAQHSIRIAVDVPTCGETMLLVAIYLSEPHQSLVTDDQDDVEMHLVEQFELSIQLSTHHTLNPAANFLLVTNSECARNRIQGVQNFINDGLQMQSDEWNCSLYGGLQYHPESVDADADYVLAQYSGKTIIFLGNVFKFFRSGPRVAYDLCDPSLVAEICMAGTRCLFLGCSDQPNFKKWLKSWTFPVPCSSDMISEHQKVSQAFAGKPTFCKSISQKRIVGSNFEDIEVYSFAANSTWFDIKKGNSAAKAKQLKKYLRSRLPQERFLVTTFENEADDSKERSGRIAVLQGLPQSMNVIATERHSKGSDFNFFEAYMVVDALPITVAIKSLCIESEENPGAVPNGPSHDICNPLFASEAIFLSILHRSHMEIRTFLRRQHGIYIPSSHSSSNHDLTGFFRVHLPTLSHIFFYESCGTQPTECDPPPEQVYDLLIHALAACLPQKKRHITRSVTMPILNHRKALRSCILLAIKRFVLPRSSNALSPRQGNSKAAKDYTRAAKNLHSLRNKNGARDTHSIIMDRLMSFTQKSAHEFTHGQISARDLVPRTEFCTAKEWDQRWEEGQKLREQVLERTKDAWEVIGGMTLQT